MEIVNFLKKIPPMTRILFTFTLVQSTLIYTSIVSGYYAYFVPRLVVKFPPELWRLCTPFMLTGPNLAYILDLYSLYTYGVALERDAPRFALPGDFLVYVLFVATFILLTAGFWLHSPIFLSILNVAFSYTYGQVNRGQQVTFIVVPLRVEVVPWAIIGLTVILAGWPVAFTQFLGLVAAHLFEYLTQLYPKYGGGRNYITTPPFIRRWFRASPSQGIARSYGRAFNTSGTHQDDTRGSSSNVASGFSGADWNSRGPGRRLGGS